MPDYRVNLEIYNGPLDLLLYLIRREEVDIYDIPIARITEQYIQYVEMLRSLDPNLAGDFLVMAATLMEIKTQMLLPTPPAEEGAEEGLEIDPRAELVRQLLEYKAFRDAADDLRKARELQALKYPRRPAGLPDSPDAELDLEYVQIWDLFDAFSKLMEATGQRLRTHEVIYDDTPVELYATDILDRLERDGPMTFDRIFEGCASRGELIGLFLALLELVRLRKILAVQRANFGEIHVRLNPHPPSPQELDAEQRPQQPPAPAAPLGQYVREPGPPAGPEDQPHDAEREPQTPGP